MSLCVAMNMILAADIPKYTISKTVRTVTIADITVDVNSFK